MIHNISMMTNGHGVIYTHSSIYSDDDVPDSGAVGLLNYSFLWWW